MFAPRPLVAALRPHQWTKNFLVFAPIALSKHLFEADAFLRASLAFAIFCGLPGTVYLINDLADIERDRLHPKKRLRPLASGSLRPRAAQVAAVALGLLGLGLSAALGRAFLAVAAGYVALNLLYSFRLKHVVILDVIAISLGFVLRAVAGSVAISVPFSDWLLVCTLLLALFLALAKRRHELVTLGGTDHREILADYSPYLLDQMIAVVTASCLMAYAFYTLAPETVEKYQTDRLALTIQEVSRLVYAWVSKQK